MIKKIKCSMFLFKCLFVSSFFLIFLLITNVVKIVRPCYKKQIILFHQYIILFPQHIILFPYHIIVFPQDNILFPQERYYVPTRKIFCSLNILFNSHNISSWDRHTKMWLAWTSFVRVYAGRERERESLLSVVSYLIH